MADEPTTDVLADYSAACNEMDRLTSAPGGPGASWRWSIPAKPERDSDLVFARALAHLPGLIARLAAVEALCDDAKVVGDGIVPIPVGDVRAALAGDYPPAPTTAGGRDEQ